jgi:hypothetical protein
MINVSIGHYIYSIYFLCATVDDDGDARGAHGSRKRWSRWWRNNPDRGAKAKQWP